VSAFERNLGVQALEAAGWNQSEAARILSTRRSTLLDKIKNPRSLAEDAKGSAGRAWNGGPERRTAGADVSPA